eukprot:61223-Rhodomonas_salina.1
MQFVLEVNENGPEPRNAQVSQALGILGAAPVTKHHVTCDRLVLAHLWVTVPGYLGTRVQDTGDTGTAVFPRPCPTFSPGTKYKRQTTQNVDPSGLLLSCLL